MTIKASKLVQAESKRRRARHNSGQFSLSERLAQDLVALGNRLLGGSLALHFK